MKMRKITALLLAVLMAAGMLLTILPSAAGSLHEKFNSLKSVAYHTNVYSTPEDKLNTMTLVVQNDQYALYIQEFTAEVAVVDRVTGQILLTNPYDVADSKGSSATKDELLSQILIGYYNNEGIYVTMDSFRDAAMEEQIVLKYIRGGVRVEYTIGAGAKMRLVPYQLPKDSMEQNILKPFYEQTTTSDLSFEEYLALKFSTNSEDVAKAEEAESFDFGKLVSYYTLMDPSDPSLTAREQTAILSNYPITEKMPIYVLSGKIGPADLTRLEDYIRKYTSYSLENLLTDHETVEYEMENASPAIFRMALEYTLNDKGFQVRLPARGISFDSASYTLDTIQILPFLGAGRISKSETAVRKDEGYNFIPDGSGAIINFDKNTKTTKVSGTLYGMDFGFYEGASAATASYQTWRAPVYGTVMNSTTTAADGSTKSVRQGYVAFITEGESLTRIDAADGGTIHEYHSVSTTFFARQTDSYPLDGITVSGATAVYTKSIERKYVGNYTIQYRLLWEDDANYVGMAEAYREFLISQGILKKLENQKEDIPLYLDLLGAVTTTEKFLGMPVSAQAELTTFENAKTILAELKDTGVKNQIVRYLGWMNGGLAGTAPTSIDVESVLGGEAGLKELISYVQSEGNKIFMDFDFSYVKRTELFDGFDEEEHTSKTIDNKPAFFKTYNPPLQAFNTHVAFIISPHVITDFYGQITEKYSSFFGDGEKNISVGSLGSALNSSQDELFPMNREDAKEETVSALEKIAEEYNSVLLENGNYYTWKYASSILEIPLDSSNRNSTSGEVPFLGIVLHGYMSYTGEALNLAGDYEYTLLKTIENGANPYFVLAYDNIPQLKINGYGEYYAVEYAQWKESIAEEYAKLNEVLAPLQNATITAHEILGNRIVKVGYSNGTVIYLNYNNYAVDYQGIQLDAMGFHVTNA